MPNSTLSSLSKRGPLAVFDLDGTLVRGDCMLPFLLGYCRRHRKSALPGIALDLTLYAVGRLNARTAKEHIVRRALGGHSRSQIRSFASEFCRTWVEKQLHPVGIPLLRRHQSQGHRIIILSASPGVYVPEIAAYLGVGESVSTMICFDGDVCQGGILGENCKGPAKVDSLLAYLQGEEFGETYAYADSPSDSHILAWADHPFLITRSLAVPWQRSSVSSLKQRASAI